MSMIKRSQNAEFRTQFVPNRGFGRFAKGLLSLLVLILISSAGLFAQTPNFDQLKERFDTGEVFSAEFDHTYTDSYTEEVVSSSGSIWIDKVRYKLESEGQTVVVDGENSRVYDPNRNRVIIDTYYPEDDDFAPSRMLSGIDSTYSVSEEKISGRTRVTLTSNDDFAVFVRVEILLDAQLRPLEIKAWDISDNEIVTTFTNGTFQQSETGLFELSYPDDAEIIDMRY
ncbi:LolA family protein [Gracilimonas halophila]|uniref:Outer membrane lipoprotein carrier protein LolA n=1 Tax=Gracilimonas halophila TaxID=1834464 RepID=A0ABW5JE78_9BACT